MNVADAMTPRSDVVTVEIPGTRDDVLEYLQERKFSSVPVVKRNDDGEEFRGIISRKALIEYPDEDQLALLVEEVPTTTADASIEDVAALMVREGARRIPVVDGSLEGIVTVTDVVHTIATGDVDGDMECADIASHEVNTVYAGTPLSVAEREISYAQVPYAVVLGDDGRMAGMVTEVDVIDVARVVEGEADTGESIANQDDEWAWEGIKAVGNRYMPTRNVEIPTGPVEEVMTDDLETITKHRTAKDAAQTMIDMDIEQIPMVSGDDLIGVVRDVNLVEALV